MIQTAGIQQSNLWKSGLKMSISVLDGLAKYLCIKRHQFLLVGTVAASGVWKALLQHSVCVCLERDGRRREQMSASGVSYQK